MIFFFFWYCFDDYLARVFNNPELGQVPWWVILGLSIVTMPLWLRGRRK